MQITVWDSTTDTERILTIADLQAQDWETLTAEQLMSRLPAGMDMRMVVHILMDQLAKLTRDVKALEDQIVDKMLLEDSPKP